MANDFLEFGLPPILGSVADAGTGIGQGYVQGLQLRQQLEQNQLLNDLKKWQMLMEQRQAAFPKWSVAGEGVLAVQDPQTGQLGFMGAPPQMRTPMKPQAFQPVQPGQPIFDPNTGGFITAPGTPPPKPPVHMPAGSMVQTPEGGWEQVGQKPVDRKAFDPYQREAILNLYGVDPWEKPIVGIPGFDWSAVMKQAKAAEQKEFEEKERFKATLKSEETKTPPGYERVDGGKALRPIPGGPADLKAQKASEKDTARLSATNAQLDRLATSANELLQHPGLPRITGIIGAFPTVPGTDAANAEAKLLTLKAQVGFNTLQEMRNNSQTGGALGQVSNIEINLLQNALDSLGQAQSPEQMKASLQSIKQYAEEAKTRLREAIEGPGSEATPTPKISEPVARPSPEKRPLQKLGKPRMIPPPIGAVIGGYRFKGGDPAKRENWER